MTSMMMNFACIFIDAIHTWNVSAKTWVKIWKISTKVFLGHSISPKVFEGLFLWNQHNQRFLKFFRTQSTKTMFFEGFLKVFRTRHFDKMLYNMFFYSRKILMCTKQQLQRHCQIIINICFFAMQLLLKLLKIYKSS